MATPHLDEPLLSLPGMAGMNYDIHPTCQLRLWHYLLHTRGVQQALTTFRQAMGSNRNIPKQQSSVQEHLEASD